MYEISSEAARVDVERVHRWLSEDAYWAKGRSLERHRAAVEGSLNFGAYEKDTGEQRAYARVVTDLVTFAWLCDVYVDPVARGRGVGTQLVTAVRDHLAPYGLRRILLATNDAHGVYAKVGFEPLDDPTAWMVLR